MTSKAKYPVKTAETTLKIIEALKELDGAGVTELSKHVGVSKSGVHNHLSTLEEHEYVFNDGGTYHLGLRFLELGGYTRQQMKLYSIAQPEVKALAAETGEKANLMVEDFGRGVYLYRSKGSEAIQVDSYTGMRVYLHSTALGKAILAHLSEERVEDIIDTHGLPEESPKTITDREVLFDELERIRERGVAFDDEERLKGLRCVAAPIRDNDGHVYGSISLSAPMSRMREERFREEIPDTLISTANVIELNMTYS